MLWMECERNEPGEGLISDIWGSLTSSVTSFSQKVIFFLDPAAALDFGMGQRYFWILGSQVLGSARQPVSGGV